VMMSTMVIASATGPLLFSIARDVTGSYRNAFGGTFVVAILLVIASFWANNPQRKIKKQMDAENEGSS
jgi:OFA family oxalate/formate antiporter-like MFS transporter